MRFILDVMTTENSSQEELDNFMSKVLEVIERDSFLESNVTSIRCIDETNDDQFYSHDEYTDEQGNLVKTSPMMNAISKKQLKEDKNVLSKY